MKATKASLYGKILLVVVASFLAPNLLYGQINDATNKTANPKFNWKFVTGKVVNEDGDPLEGAVVITVKTAFGAVTDAAGNFKIVLPENSIIRVNYMGFKTATIKPVCDNEMIIRLKTERIRLESIEIYPPNYQANTGTLVGNSNKRNDIHQTEKEEKGKTIKKGNEFANVQFIEKKEIVDLNKILVVKNDTICPNLKLEDIDPNSIWSIYLLDKENAIKKYGAIAENRAIEISSIGIGNYGYIVEEMPEFSGGMTNLRNVLKTRLIYPDLALKKGIKGTVFVSFVVEESGFVTNVKIEKSIDPLLDNEVLQAVKNLPRWKAARQRGKPVKVSYTLPFLFRIPSDYQHRSTEKLQIR